MNSDKPINKARQKAQLVIANPDFQRDVLGIRKRLNIPLDGIKSNEESEKWHHEFYVSDDVYFENNHQQIGTKIRNLRELGKHREARKLQEQFNDEAPINSFNIAIKNLLKEYKLSLTWYQSTQRYVLFNDLDAMWLIGNVIIKEEIDLKTDLRSLLIEINETTTLEDIKKAWPRVKIHQKRLNSYTKSKFQPIKNFERDKEAYELKISGKSYDQIADILSEKHNKNYSYDDVASFIKRHKQKVGINQA